MHIRSGIFHSSRYDVWDTNSTKIASYSHVNWQWVIWIEWWKYSKMDKIRLFRFYPFFHYYKNVTTVLLESSELCRHSNNIARIVNWRHFIVASITLHLGLGSRLWHCRKQFTHTLTFPDTFTTSIIYTLFLLRGKAVLVTGKWIR